MKTQAAPIDKTPTALGGLLIKYKTILQTSAWIKTRRFFWAVGVVLLDVFSSILSGAANTQSSTSDNSEEYKGLGVPHCQDPLTGEWTDRYGNPCDPH
jgi:hypothetical protein